MVAKKDPSQDPKSPEFASRMIDNYVDVNPELIRDLRPFSSVSMADHNTSVEDEIRSIFERHLKTTQPIEPIFDLPQRNVQYFQLFINMIKIVLDTVPLTAVQIDSEPVGEFREAPEKTIDVTLKDGTIIKRSQPRSWSKTELIFVNSRLRKGEKLLDIYEDYQKSNLTASRTKSSVASMLSRLRTGKKKIV